MSARKWLWNGPGGRREVFAVLAPARLWSPEQGRWLAPGAYRLVFNELADGLCSHKGVAPEEALRQLDELFLLLSQTEREMKEAGRSIPLEISQAWEDAARAILKAKEIVKAGPRLLLSSSDPFGTL